MIYIIVYNEFVLYEIVFLNYFFKDKVKFVCLNNEESITSFEGVKIIPDFVIDNLKLDKHDALIIPGGNIMNILNSLKLKEIITESYNNSNLIGCICSGVDYLHSVEDIKITETVKTDLNSDVVIKNNVITANPNAYVDFAIEIANVMGIFKDKEDYIETYDFFLHKKRYTDFK